MNPRRQPVRGFASFPLLAETFLVGVIVAIVSIPVVTAVPALAAAVRHLRRHLLGERDDYSRLAREIGTAVRQLWPVGVATPAVLLVLGFNLWLAATGALPAAALVTVVSGVLSAVVLVVVLRLAGRWSPQERWSTQVRAAALRTRTDLAGSALLVSAVGLAAAIVWMLLPLLLVAGGLLALAALSVESRTAGRTRG